MAEAWSERDIRGVPLWLLREYLVELGGGERDEFTVIGAGWSATLAQRPDFVLGSLRVGEVRVTVEGDEGRRAALVAAFDRRLMTRGGG